MQVASWKPVTGAVLLLTFVSTAAATNADPAHSPDADHCSRFRPATVKWPDPTTRLLATIWHERGSQVRAMRQGPAASVAEHCEVTGIMQERAGVDGQRYSIKFRLRLPGQWNGRFFFEGGGGTEGELGPAIGFIGPDLPTALDRGYAVASQDSGHDNATNSLPERGGVVAFGFDPQARANYGGLAAERVARAAKAIIHSYYARDPERSYFVGCSAASTMRPTSTANKVLHFTGIPQWQAQSWTP